MNFVLLLLFQDSGPISRSDQLFGLELREPARSTAANRVWKSRLDSFCSLLCMLEWSLKSLLSAPHNLRYGG